MTIMWIGIVFDVLGVLVGFATLIFRLPIDVLWVSVGLLGTGSITVLITALTYPHPYSFRK